MGFAEIERGPGDVPEFSGRDQRRVDRGVSVGIYRQSMGHDVRIAVFARQVEIAVIGDIDDRRLIRLRLVFDCEHVIVAERVDRADVELAGVTAGPVRARVGEYGACRRSALCGLQLPDNLVEAVQATVEMVGPVVGLEGVLVAVQGEAAVGDAVGIAAHRSAEILRLGEIFGRRRVAEHDVAAHALPVRHGQRLDGGAEGHDPGPHAVPVGEFDGLDPGAVVERPEIDTPGVGGRSGLRQQAEGRKQRYARQDSHGWLAPFVKARSSVRGDAGISHTKWH